MLQTSMTCSGLLQTVCWFVLSIVPSAEIRTQSRQCETERYYQQKSYTVNSIPRSERGLLPRAITVLPVVVHIVWNSPDENIPQQLIEQQIDRLNIEFNNAHVQRNSVPAEFRPLIGNPGIRFCLVRSDPGGKPHSGIVRSQTTLKNIGSAKDASGRYMIHYSSNSGQDAWDPSRYINIWIGKMESIFGRSTIGGTTFPREEDGVVVDPSQVGVDFRKNVLGRTLVHEMGHYLGLQHTWGSRTGECSEDDGIPDTPPQESAYFGCPVHPQRSCGNNNMFMNFMDFVDDFCMDLFTQGQVVQMHKTLANFRPGLLLTNTNCTDLPGEVVLSGVSHYFNPSRQSLTLRATVIPDQPVFIEVSTILGQRIHRDQLDPVSTVELSTISWATGIYLINLRYNKERRTIKLFKP